MFNKSLLLTGATSGLGYGFTQLFQKYPNRLIITGRRHAKLREIEKEYRSVGLDCHSIAGDITDPDFRQNLMDFCIEKNGGLDCLINNAGVGAMGRFDSAHGDRMRKVFELNFFSTAELTRLAIPHLIEGDDPIIVNIGSVLGHRAVPLKSEYCASKFALHGFSDALRAELRNFGIDVLHVCPATIDTAFFEAAIEDNTGKNWKAGRKMDAAYVARKTIVAMEKRSHELVLPWSAKGLVWLDRLAPSLANFLVAKFGQ